MRRRTSIGLWLCAVGVVASCSLFPRTPLVTPGPAGSAGPSDLGTFDEGGITFTYPAAWHELHFSVDGSFSHLIADLATVDIPEPCATTEVSVGTEVVCADRFQLKPDSLVVHIGSGGFPGFDIRHLPASAIALTVDGQPAFVRDLTAKDLTVDDPRVGADVTRIWTLSNVGAPGNFYEIDAYIRGPDLGPIEDELAALIASLRYDPPTPSAGAGSSMQFPVPSP